MINKLFTTQEIEELRQNQYVKFVSEKGITYTEEIKKYITVQKYHDTLLEYTISDIKDYGAYEELKIFINPIHQPFDINLEKEYLIVADQNGLLKQKYKIEANNN